MANPSIPEPQSAAETNESFAELFAESQKRFTRKPGEGAKGMEGRVIAVAGDSVTVDIGYKIEGVLPLAALQGPGETVKPGDKLQVTITGRDAETGYYKLSRIRVARPTDWTSLERAFAEKAIIAGTVTGAVKGGLSVDVGVRAFLPASRSGAREAADLEKLVGQEIRCRITKLDVADEDVVVDRRMVVEEEERAAKDHRYSEIREGQIVRGTVRSLMDYGAFVEIGGCDALLHVGDISWTRVSKPSDVLSVGQEIEAQIVKFDPEQRRVSIGMKQLLPAPWDLAADKYKVGERVRGTVTRLADFGAFVELEPGIEGLIHISEMAWSKRVKRPSDVVKPGDTVEAVILAVNQAQRRISLGLKQALGDPWADAPQKFAPGTVVEGPVSSMTKFGAFVHLAEGIEGMIHVSEISAEKRLDHPQDALKVGQAVKAQVLDIDTEKRQLRLSIKQLVPTSIDEYVAERKVGDTVTGRVTDVRGNTARVELGEGILASCRLPSRADRESAPASETKLDMSSLSTMLNAKWKVGSASAPAKPDAVEAGQIRGFKIAMLDAAAKKIELELV